MLGEVLNIEWNTKRLLIAALNKYETQTIAAAALGITVRTVQNMIKQYGVEKNKSGEYFSNKKLSVLVEV